MPVIETTLWRTTWAAMGARTTVVAAALGLAVALPGACVLEEADTGTALAMLRARQKMDVDALAQAFCTNYYACGCTEDWPDFDDEPECLDFVSKLLLGHLEQGIDADLPYDDACLAAHVELIEHLGCTDRPAMAFDAAAMKLWEAAEHCRSYVGEIDQGQPCTSLPTGRGDDCAPGLTCHPDFATCQQLAPIAKGELCEVDDGERGCEVGSECTDNENGADPPRCLAHSPVGQACAGGWSCELAGYCNFETGRCQTRLPAGADCLGEDDVRCDFGLTCRNLTCEAKAALGEACDVLDCGVGLTCNATLDVCEPLPAAVCDMQEHLP